MWREKSELNSSHGKAQVSKNIYGRKGWEGVKEMGGDRGKGREERGWRERAG